MKVVLTEVAWDDLLGIGLAIKKHNSTRADSFIDELYWTCQEIGEMPRAFPVVRSDANIRRRVHGSYLIFYQIEADRVEILRVLHGAMNYEPLLFPVADASIRLDPAKALPHGPRKLPPVRSSV